MPHLPSAPSPLGARSARRSRRHGTRRPSLRLRLLGALLTATATALASAALLVPTASTAEKIGGLSQASSWWKGPAHPRGDRRAATRASRPEPLEHPQRGASAPTAAQQPGATTAVAAGHTSSGTTSAATPSTAAHPPAPVPPPASSSPTAPPPAPRGPVVQPPSSIAADCSGDVTDALTRWVNSVPDGSSVLFAAKGCYLVNGSVTVTRKTGLTFDGNGATFTATRTVSSPEVNRAQWHTDYGSDLTFENMTLVGVHPQTQAYNAAYEYDHNLFIRGTHGVRVDHVTARGAYGDNVAIAQGLDWSTIPSGITITNSVFDGAGRMGISCVACRDVTVDHDTISNTAIFSFDLEIEGNGWPGRNIRFTDNTVGGVIGGAMFSIGAPVNWSGVDVGGVTIAGNRMTSFADGSFDCDPAISLKDSLSHVDGLTIEGNELNSPSDGILVRNASGVVVRNNVIHFRDRCGGTAGVHLVSSPGAVVSGNTTTGFPRPLVAE